MAVAFRSIGAISTVAGAGNLVLAVPAGVVSGDVMLAFFQFDYAAWPGNPNPVEPTPPAGWTELIPSPAIGTHEVKTYYRVAGGSEPANYTWTLLYGPAEGCIAAWSGCDPVTPIPAHNSFTGSAAGAQWAARAGGAHVYLSFGDAVTNTITSPSTGNPRHGTFTTRRNVAGTYGYYDVTDEIWAAGATGALNARSVPGAGPHAIIGHWVYLNPAAAPAITVTSPTGVVAGGGPNVTFSWSNGLAFTERRVRVQSNGGGTTYFDSGWVSYTHAGTLADTAVTYTADLVTAGAPTDGTGTALQVVVDERTTTVDGVALTYTATTTQTFGPQWGVTSCTITAPTSAQVLSSSAVTATWSFASTRGFTQGWYRVRLLYTQTGVVVFDTGWTSSAAVSLLLPYALTDQSQYTLGVQLKNTMGVPS